MHIHPHIPTTLVFFYTSGRSSFFLSEPWFLFSFDHCVLRLSSFCTESLYPIFWVLFRFSFNSHSHHAGKCKYWYSASLIERGPEGPEGAKSQFAGAGESRFKSQRSDCRVARAQPVTLPPRAAALWCPVGAAAVTHTPGRAARLGREGDTTHPRTLVKAMILI